eukprot:CAMPEP_0206232156 /NCGR_PEP_ID=MMETSP0047_2-20121206/11257_1 /ASSEMBLY_ACC=CAM_ASM_000192 /TAXON_ID=195065 /ORGANISM="Chroomonas mesostigmatica_cf, Strain CCMP1168" /LENGTH=74 /DNA_ID=CAMNT_0053655857 /DNA_START=285 /DNA_END=509 /DNA_ORIENTATION=-
MWALLKTRRWAMSLHISSGWGFEAWGAFRTADLAAWPAGLAAATKALTAPRAAFWKEDIFCSGWGSRGLGGGWL